MKILWVFAHPDPRSLNGQLRDAVLPRLAGRGHDVVESDLYALGWDPVLSRDDVAGPAPTAGEPTSDWQRRAHRKGTLRPEIRREQAKLCSAELIVLQFPLWWYGPPAILKGWFDRILVNGFAFGVVDPATGHVRKYGDGGLAGRRGLAVVTAGDRPGALAERGISGHIEDVLWPLLHGTFHYTGIAPLRPHLLTSVHHWEPGRFEQAGEAGAAFGRMARGFGQVGEAGAAFGRVNRGFEQAGKAGAAFGRLTRRFEREVNLLTERVDGAGREAPIRYRTLAGGDYGEDFVLRPSVAPGRNGNAAHVLPGTPADHPGRSCA